MNVVVTGSSSGIGRALALRLLARGDRVLGIARSDQSALAASHPDSFLPVVCDVADWTQVEKAAAGASRRWTQADGLVCCAAIQGAIGPALSADARAWSAAVRANLDGTFYAMRALLPLLKASRRAKIVCFSGGGATKPRPNFSAYGASKAAVVRLVETIAWEERAAPFDINAVAPGAIATRMTDGTLAAGEAAGREEVEGAKKIKAQDALPMERALALVEWLLSPASDGISGRLISAPWDPWDKPGPLQERLRDPGSDLYTLRRVTS